MAKSMDAEKVKQVLERGVAQIIERNELNILLTSGKKLRVKLGIDPTAPDLHLGHAVVLRKLKEFQDLGHKIVLIIGDFTAQIGDPSGKSKTRPPLSETEVKKNMKSYLAQAGKMIDVRKAEIRRNSEWHKKGGLKALLELSRAASIQQILEREDFANRIKQGETISMLESLYPLLQGYDSVAVKADVELGGTDQTFNLLMGRRVQRHFGMREQQVLTTPLLVGLDGTHKMSKSLGNYIGVTDAPNDMFGKIMSVPDNLMAQYFELCAGVSKAEQESLERHLSPRDLKARLAFEIVKLSHGEKAAKMADENFTNVFSKKDFSSEDVKELKLSSSLSVADLVLVSGVTKSKSEAWRLIEQGAVSLDDEVKKDPREALTLRGGEVVKIGKRNFFRAKISDKK